MNVCGFNDDSFIFGIIKPIPRSTLENVKDTAIKKSHLKRIRIHNSDIAMLLILFQVVLIL